MTDQDPGDEHVQPAIDPVNGRHLVWPQCTGRLDANQARLGVVTRCGQFVPKHWAVNVLALTDCLACRGAA